MDGIFRLTVVSTILRHSSPLKDVLYKQATPGTIIIYYCNINYSSISIYIYLRHLFDGIAQPPSIPGL